MKKIFFLTIIALFTVNVYGQKTGKFVGVNSQFDKDTTHTFTLYKIDGDVCKAKLIKYFGTPVTNTAGQAVWTNIEIAGIGKWLQVSFTDGICTMKKVGTQMDMNCKPFTDETDKAEKLSHFNKSNQEREMMVIINDKDNKNAVTGNAKTKIVVDLLEKIIQ